MKFNFLIVSVLMGTMFGCGNTEDPDLIDPFQKSGRFLSTSMGASLYSSINGWGILDVSNDQSTLTIGLTGLTASTEYSAHLHNGTCVSGGGGHYLQDADVEDSPENGLWPGFTTDENGNGLANVSNLFAVTDEGRSVVVHQPETGDRIACLDLQQANLNLINKEANFVAIAQDDIYYENISGSVQLVATTERKSWVKVLVKGLTPSAEYPAHLHVDTCANEGGGHYLQDSEGEDAPENGLWPTVTVDENGVGVGFASNDFIVNGLAKSVVIHEPVSKLKIFCADLKTSIYAASGNLTPTEKGDELYPDGLNGYANIFVKEGWTKASLAVANARPNETYAAHVHTGSCESGGGGHYLHDTTGEDVTENGLWFTLTTGDDGFGFTTATNTFAAHRDAQSVVLHEPVTKDRIGCIDLSKDLVTAKSGIAVATEKGIELYPELSGFGYLENTSAGKSNAYLSAQGLTAETTYKAHVHDAACEVGGGAHYLNDRAGADEAENGLWLVLNTDAAGAGWASIEGDFLTRPDAKSVVLHQPETNERIICMDLN